MTSRKKVPFYTKIDPVLKAALRRYKVDVGVPEAVQIDKALRQWLSERDVIRIDRADGSIGSVERDVPPSRERRRRSPKRRS